MGGTIADLEKTLGQIITAFNAHKVHEVEKYLDEDANVFSVDAPHPHQGKSASTEFLNAWFLQHQILDKPTFSPRNNTVEIDTHGAADGALTHATITGVADWYDDNGPDVLNFDFECVYQGRWLFQRVSATVVPPK